MKPHPSKLRLAVECLILFGGTTAFTVITAAVSNALH